jgi:hypothetical protein
MTTTTDYIKSLIDGTAVEVKLMSSGRLNCGVSGSLLGAFQNADDALHAIAERLRQIGGWVREAPSLPQEFVDGVRSLRWGE